LQVIRPDNLLGLDFAFDHRVIVADYLLSKGQFSAAAPGITPPDWKRSTCHGGSAGFYA
jgi:hypothetical protein